MQRLNLSNFHMFVQQNSRILLWASWSASFNAGVAKHFSNRAGPPIALAHLQPEVGSDWFAGEVRRGLKRSHEWHDSSYYLILDGRFVDHHRGVSNDQPAVVLGYALGALLAGNPQLASETIEQRNATVVIAHFEARLSKRQRGQVPKSTTSPPDPYEVLGVGRNATPAEIDDAYRRKISQNHPDLVARAGPEIQAFAAARTVELNIAREQLRAAPTQVPRG